MSTISFCISYIPKCGIRAGECHYYPVSGVSSFKLQRRGCAIPSRWRVGVKEGKGLIPCPRRTRTPRTLSTSVSPVRPGWCISEVLYRRHRHIGDVRVRLQLRQRGMEFPCPFSSGRYCHEVHGERSRGGLLRSGESGDGWEGGRSPR